MITGLVHVPRPSSEGTLEALADTLSALVAGVAAGLVGDAVVIAPGAEEEVAMIADATGAALVTVAERSDPWRAGAAAARREWLFCLVAGDVPGEGWIRAVDRFVGTAREDAMLGRLRRPRGALAHVGALVEARAGARHAKAGDIVRRDWLLRPPTGRMRVRRLGAEIERPRRD